jgi:hypothetical protein
MTTLTLAGFWFATMVYVWSAWLNWRGYKRWQRAWEDLERARDRYLLESTEGERE